MELLQAAVGATLGLAAVSKLRTRSGFYAHLAALRLPRASLKVVGLGVIAAELLAASLLLVPQAPHAAGAAIATGLGAGFVGTQIVAMMYRIGACACIGRFDQSLLPGYALFRATSLFIAATGLFTALRIQNVDTHVSLSSSVLGALLACTFLVSVALLNDFTRLQRYRRRLVDELGFDPHRSIHESEGVAA